MSGAVVFDATPCALGEGPLWHPGRGQLFWFDILAGRLLARDGGATRHWDFDGTVSAAGWVDDTTLLVASDSALLHFDLGTGASEVVAPLEPDMPGNRPNDGRADPWGGFWLGTMDRDGTAPTGAIYRYYRGEVRRLFAPITIPNAICFSPDGGHACFSDTVTGQVQRVRLEPANGWPAAEPEVFLDLRAERLNPDGAVMDADGVFWNAQWGASRVAAYDADGQFLRAVAVPARQSSCPAFGGPDLTTLFVTSARQGLSTEVLEAEPLNGQTFAAEGVARGQAEHQVIL